MARGKPLLVLLGAIPVLATLFVVAAPAAHAVATDTSVMIIPPGLGTVNSYNTLTASVTSQNGATAPVGSIQFRTAAGSVIAAAQTQRGATIAEATASIVWYAPELTTYGFSAIFYPENPALLNSSVTRSNTAVEVTPNGQNVQIEVPQIYRGITSELIATTYPTTLQGSVAFTINGSPMSASITVVNGRATFPFVTQSLGWQDIGVSFTKLNNPNVFGVTHSWVNVLPSKGPAPVSFTPAISTLLNGQAQVFELTSPAGPINALTAAGGCVASALTVTAISGSGDCSLTAIAPWGQGYDGAATTTFLKLEPGRQSANLNQGIANTVVGQRVNLITGDNRTNAGRGIKWRVITGAA
ncbi:MAG: hypothetical protein O2943_10035, partial [Actinomycetota bacterium]|nr:hypothetical protein [Actinomycetota bacterium]